MAEVKRIRSGSLVNRLLVAVDDSECLPDLAAGNRKSSSHGINLKEVWMWFHED